MPPPLRTGRALVLQRVLGLAFVALLLGSVALTAAVYQKAFTPVVRVALEADRAGNQLSRGADVKARGLIVGEVRSVETTGTGAVLRLALDPEQARLIPSDTTARLLPKTLFGEKYVALSFDSASPAPPLRDGDVIARDRSRVAVETEAVLDRFLPLLQALRPEQLNATLSAVSTALRGRGDALGDNLVRQDEYFRRLNPELPALVEDLRGVADLAESYDRALPDLLEFLDNSAATARTLVAEESRLAAVLRSTASSADTAEQVLGENRERLVRLAADSLPSLRLYASFAPMYPCVLASLAEQEKTIGEAFGGRLPGLHITLEATRDNGPYVPGDEPRYLDRTGPKCLGLPPGPPLRPFPAPYNPDDGYRDGQPVDPRTGAPPEGSTTRGRAVPGGFTDADLLRAAAAPVLDVPPEEVPDVATLLLGPVARGTVVGVAPG